jgi:NAD(P)H-dependent FMN reductase
MIINSTKDLKTAIRNGPYAWPGGYPLFFIASDGEALSFESVCDQLKQVMREVKMKDARSGWRVVAVDVNWEDENLYCAQSGKRIESAYGEN